MTPTAKNQLQDTAGDYIYDAAGNLIQPGPIGGPYVFDAENHLISAGGLAYLYDGDGKRVGKAPASTPTQPNYLYWYGMGPQILEETDGAGKYLYRDFYFNGMLLARGEDDWTDHFFSDALGNARCVYGDNDPDGGCSDYYPFGAERPISYGGVNVPFKFTGKERDSESGLDNFGARFDSSNLGRFISPDWSARAEPVPYVKLGDPQTLNLYAYVRNNPLNRTDPSGHYICHGTKDQCQAVANGLTQARAALQSRNLTKEQRSALAKVVGTFGRAGDDHDGVTISFGKTNPRAAADAYSHRDENGLLKTDITFNSKTFSTSNTNSNTALIGGILIHERSHGLDWVARGGREAESRTEIFRTELRASNVESFVPKALGVVDPPLWSPTWRPEYAEGNRFTGVMLNAHESTAIWCQESGAPGC